MKRKKIKLIYIKWFDSYYGESVHATENMFEESPFIMETTGFYVGEEKGYICLATEKVSSNEYKYRHYIAKVNILETKITTI